MQPTFPQNGKAPEPDNIAIDLLKEAGEIIRNKLASLFAHCLKLNVIPDHWNDEIIALLHEKDNPKDLVNYRPIGFFNCVYKLPTKVTTNVNKGDIIVNGKKIEEVDRCVLSYTC